MGWGGLQANRLEKAEAGRVKKVETELSGFVFRGEGVRVRDPSLGDSVRAPVRACAPVERRGGERRS